MKQPAILITGSSSGIGRDCALRMEKEGYIVYAGVRKELNFKELKNSSSDYLKPIYLDVTRSEDIEKARKLIQEERDELGLQGIVNNAGILVSGPIEILPLENFKQQFDVNVFGVIEVTQAFLPLLRQGKGRIVNVGSIAGHIAMPYRGPYCATKFALRAINDSLRIELMPWKIPVSIVDPGAIQTPLRERSKRNAEETLSHLPQEKIQRYEKSMELFGKSMKKIEKKAIPPDKVVNAIHHALTAKKPKPQYTVGLDAKFRHILEVLPHWLRDRILFRFFHKE